MDCANLDDELRARVGALREFHGKANEVNKNYLANVRAQMLPEFCYHCRRESSVPASHSLLDW